MNDSEFKTNLNIRYTCSSRYDPRIRIEGGTGLSSTVDFDMENVSEIHLNVAFLRV